MRWLVFVHRYLGIFIGILMLAWCVSGGVMMYVRYPELTPANRLRHLQPVDWHACCAATVSSLADDARIDRFQIEMLGARLVLRVKANGRALLVDLADGQTIAQLSADEALAIATTFSRTAGVIGPPRLEGLIDHDQWTVSGAFSAARPLFLVSLPDTGRTQLYISAVSGRVVQVTTSRQRIWNWLGAIPHWLYFAELRRDVALWSQLVIWLSLLGCFLTCIGIYIGVQRFLQRPRRRWSPYDGVLYWHHVPGLIFGLFLLTWVASGLVSMNPWGFLDSDLRSQAAGRLEGGPLSGAQVKAVIRSLAGVARLPEIVSVDSAPLLGHLYLVATTRTGARWRFDATGTSARINDQDWTGIARLLSTHRIATPELISYGDEYYFTRPGIEVGPVYRIVSDDQQQTRYYFDPVTASLLASFDSNERWYRWLHQGLHTMDFTAALRERPRWDILMLIMLSGTIAITATGTYVGWRRLAKTRHPG